MSTSFFARLSLLFLFPHSPLLISHYQLDRSAHSHHQHPSYHLHPLTESSPALPRLPQLKGQPRLGALRMSSSTPSISPDPQTQTKEKLNKGAWPATEEEALITAVKDQKTATIRWSKVEEALLAKGFAKRSDKGLKSHYQVLKARAKATGGAVSFFILVSRKY